jgi:hypothetical protein
MNKNVNMMAGNFEGNVPEDRLAYWSSYLIAVESSGFSEQQVEAWNVYNLHIDWTTAP